MTTAFLDIPKHSSSQSLLVDDMEIEAPRPPSLLQQLRSFKDKRRESLSLTFSSLFSSFSSLEEMPLNQLMAWHHLKEVLVVAEGHRLHIYIFERKEKGKGVRGRRRRWEDQAEDQYQKNTQSSVSSSSASSGWLPPVATPARPIKSVAWSTLSNTLIVGSNEGVYLYRFLSLDNEGMKTSSYTFLPSSSAALSFVDLARDAFTPAPLLSRSVDLLSVSPQGRLFCGVLSPVSSQRTLGHQLCIWDMYNLTASNFHCSLGSASSTLLAIVTLGVVPFRSHSISCLSWSPSGQFIAVGFCSGTVVLVDTERWEQTPVCQATVGISKICWVSPVDCVMIYEQPESNCKHGGIAHSFHVPDSGRGDADHELAACSPIHDTQVSSLPIKLFDNSLGNLIKTFCLDKNLVDEESFEMESIYVKDIVCDNLESDYVAVAFAYKHALLSKSFTLPFVCLFLCSVRPFLSLTFISIIDNQSSNNGIANLVFPLEMSFNNLNFPDASSTPVQIAIRWSNDTVSISPCQTNKMD